jgi:hypothetical protein
MPLFQKTFSQKLFALILVICLIGLTAGPILLLPRKAQAQCPVTIIQESPGTSQFIIKKAWESLQKIWRKATLTEAVIQAGVLLWEKAHKLVEWSYGVLLNLFLHQILAMITNDIVDWIQNGGTPRFLSMNLDDYLWEAVDKAGGAFVDQYLGAGWLCEPFDIDIKIALLEVPTFEEEVRCTLTDIVDNIDDFYEDFSKGGWKGWIGLTKPQNNFYGALLLAQAEKTSVEETAKKELEKDIEMGEGYLSPKDCTWYDKNGTVVKEQIDVWGTPSLPKDENNVSLCSPDPNNPGKTLGGFEAPCYHKCRILTPASSVKRIADEATTNFYRQINAQIGAATAKAGPFAVYVQAIVNALINRVMEEGLDLVTEEHVPEYGELGGADEIPEISNPESITQDQADAGLLLSYLNSIKGNLDELLQEQQTNLAVLGLIPAAYSALIPTLDNVISSCSSTPYTNYESWAETKISEAEAKISDIENRRIPALGFAVATTRDNWISNVNTATTSVQGYLNKIDDYLEKYELAGGVKDPTNPNDPLTLAETAMLNARNQAITDSQTVISAIKGTTYSSAFADLAQEIFSAITIVIEATLAVEQERGNPDWPAPNTLYAELEAAQEIEDTANEYITTCLVWAF